VDAGHALGVRMRDFGPFGDPARIAAGARSLLVECGFHGDPQSRRVAEDQCARFLETAGTLGAAECAALLPGWRLPDAAQSWILEVTAAVVAREGQTRFVRPLRGLEVIPQAGTVIGMTGDEPIETPYDDCVLVMPSLAQARPGVTVVRFARRRRAGASPA
jgi:hypothetical protein